MKDVMAFVEAGGSSSHFEAAAEIAKAHGARLTGVCAAGLGSIPGYVSVEMGADLLAQLQEGRRLQARRLEETFLACAARRGVSVTWSCEEREAIAVLLQHGRTADLAVLRQDVPGEVRAAAEVGHVAIALGRPVIQIPAAGFAKPIGRRIVVAWNGSRESARAMHDALPFLIKAEAVLAIAVDPEADEPGLKSLLAHLSRHGVDAGLRPITSKGAGIAQTLLEAAAEFAADLLVMGAYGHSRARELVLGGATRDVLRNAELPVLISH